MHILNLRLPTVEILDFERWIYSRLNRFHNNITLSFIFFVWTLVFFIPHCSLLFVPIERLVFLIVPWCVSWQDFSAIYLLSANSRYSEDQLMMTRHEKKCQLFLHLFSLHWCWAVSMECVDELKLLMDMRKLMKCDLPNRVIIDFASGPRIKAKPIINGRNSSLRGITPIQRLSKRRRIAKLVTK